MIDQELSSGQNLERDLNRVSVDGECYANDLNALLPDLFISSNDEAAGFDVGAGGDLVAFKKLGFKQAVWTNEPDSKLKFEAPNVLAQEQRVLIALLQSMPPEYYGSSMTAGDWLNEKDFQPKLTTMLHIAPIYFRQSANPASFLKLFGTFAQRLPSSSKIVLSAYNDHANSERAFVLAYDAFLAQGLKTELYLDAKADPFRSLGSRILVLSGAKS